ncbi:hypothetical protein BDV59DRAFT_37880 [Aspergillus ambiguus]|uniref:uncharacterized protein n=1 Tax=Aspergillus ambiguus TaxID=176160 RepID=UPI003CCD8BD1
MIFRLCLFVSCCMYILTQHVLFICFCFCLLPRAESAAPEAARGSGPERQPAIAASGPRRGISGQIMESGMFDGDESEYVLLRCK